MGHHPHIAALARGRDPLAAHRSSPGQVVDLDEGFYVVLDDDGGEWGWDVYGPYGLIAQGHGAPSRREALKHARDAKGIACVVGEMGIANPGLGPLQSGVVHMFRIGDEPVAGEWAESPGPATLFSIMETAQLYSIETRARSAEGACPWWTSDVRALGHERTYFTLHVRHANGQHLSPADMSDLDALIMCDPSRAKPHTARPRAAQHRRILRARVHA